MKNNKNTTKEKKYYYLNYSFLFLNFFVNNKTQKILIKLSDYFKWKIILKITKYNNFYKNKKYY